MKKPVKYEFTWCDYLTQCKYYPDIMIGSYECSQCEHHNSFEQKPLVKDGYSRYFEIGVGFVDCNKYTV